VRAPTAGLFPTRKGRLQGAPPGLRRLVCGGGQAAGQGPRWASFDANYAHAIALLAGRACGPRAQMNG